jgi:hypothetical protein
MKLSGLILFSLCIAVASRASASCSELAGTGDGWVKEDAFGAAQEGLAQAIYEFEAKHKGAELRITAQQVKPLPYWRDKVTGDLLLKPDIVTPKSYTVCWKGVVSHVVCTSGSKVCW